MPSFAPYSLGPWPPVAALPWPSTVASGVAGPPSGHPVFLPHHTVLLDPAIRDWIKSWTRRLILHSRTHYADLPPPFETHDDASPSPGIDGAL